MYCCIWSNLTVFGWSLQSNIPLLMILKVSRQSLISSVRIGLIITIVLSAVLVGGCSTVDEHEIVCGICGKYVRPDNQEVYLLINSDGTFKHKSPEPWGVACVLTDNWELEGDTVLLIWPGCSNRVELSLQGDTIIYEADTGSFVYTKQDEQ